MSNPFENIPEAPNRFSRQRRRLSEGDSLSYEDGTHEEDKEEDEDDMDISNLNDKMQGMQETTMQRNIFLRETFT
jgi:hypothetical protein